ncbi:MGA2 Protein MGA2 [Candida maltosa Xu316]
MDSVDILDEFFTFSPQPPQSQPQPQSWKFGNPSPITTPPSIDPDASYLDFNNDSVNTLPYVLKIGKLPSYSRVETMIKLDLSLIATTPTASAFNQLKISQDLISKPKLCLSEEIPFSLRPSTLFMDAFVLTNNLNHSCQICKRCTEREKKRSSRGTKSSGKMWDGEAPKKAIIINSKELIPLAVVPGCESKFDLSARVICYCRHHKEQEGFRILIVLKDYVGNVVARQISTPILIMDRKKSSSTPTNSSKTTDFQLSPPESSASEAVVDQPPQQSYKRKKLSSTATDDSFSASTFPMYTSGYSPLSSQIFQAPQQQSQQQQQQFLPSIQKIIPAQGSIRGGIEVTILGFNFRPGLSVKFGANQALATHCWSETTIVTYLPPAAQPGQVLVTFENQDHSMMGGLQQQQIFTYTDDSDRQLIELALQIVGLKMNGKLEDAKNIAKRIVGTDTNNTGNNTNSSSTNTSPNTSEWFDSDNKQFAKLNKLVEYFESRANNDSDLKKWSSMKTSEIFGEEEEEYFADSETIPSYKSIFPATDEAHNEHDAGVTSDSSEDMVVSYINHPRKTVENDKMLIFFWIPTLVGILTVLFLVYVMGFQLNDNFVFDKVVSYISTFT